MVGTCMVLGEGGVTKSWFASTFYFTYRFCSKPQRRPLVSHRNTLQTFEQDYHLFHFPLDIPGLMSSKKDEAEEEDEHEEEKDDGEGDDGMDVGGGHSSTVGKKRKQGASKRGTASHLDEVGADEIPPPTKKQKPLCKYGPKCYQTNPTHQELFEHPWVSLILVSCPDPTRGERVWWHSADFSGFIKNS